MNTEPISSSMFDELTPVTPEAVAPNQQAPTEPTPTPTEPQVPQVPETPAAETPVVTPVAPSAPEPSFDFKAIFGDDLDSADKVKQTLTDYQSRLKELETREPDFANDDLRFKNYALKAGFDEPKANILKSVKDGTLTDPKDIVAARLQVEYGWDKQRVDNYMNRTYKLGEEYDAEDPDVQAAKDQLEMTAVIAKSFLQEQADKVQVPQKVDYQSIVQQQLETWKPVLPNLVKDNSVLKVADGIDYAVPQETLDAVGKYALEVLNLEAGYDPAKHGKEMSELINKEVWYRERNNILNYVKTEFEKKAIREKANVPVPGGTTTVPAGDKSVDDMKHVFKQMADERNKGW